MRFGQWLGLIATAAAALLLWSLREVLILVFAAVVLAMAICTLVGVTQERLRCNRPAALSISLGGLVLLAVLTTAVVIPPFVAEFQELLRQVPAALQVAMQLLRETLERSSQCSMAVKRCGLQQSWQNQGSTSLDPTGACRDCRRRRNPWLAGVVVCRGRQLDGGNPTQGLPGDRDIWCRRFTGVAFVTCSLCRP